MPPAAEKPERVERMLGGKVSAGSMKVVLLGLGLGLRVRVRIEVRVGVGVGVGVRVGVGVGVEVSSRAPVGSEVGEEEGEAIE